MKRGPTPIADMTPCPALPRRELREAAAQILARREWERTYFRARRSLRRAAGLCRACQNPIHKAGMCVEHYEEHKAYNRKQDTIRRGER